MNDDQGREDMARIEAHLNALMDHFDTVQIMATRHEAGEKGGTVSVDIGAGNYFARYGHVKTWLLKQEEQTRINVQGSQEYL